MLRSKHVTSWKYLTVQLSRLSADDAGDPDLYGMFYGGSSVRSCTCILCSCRPELLLAQKIRND